MLRENVDHLSQCTWFVRRGKKNRSLVFAGGLGARVHLESVPLGEPVHRDDFILFSESNSRFLVEVSPEHKGDFEEIMKGVALAVIGEIIETEVLEIYSVDSRKVVSASLAELKEAWQRPLRW